LPQGATFTKQALARRRKARKARHIWKPGQSRRRLLGAFILTSLAFGFILVRVGMLQTAEAKDYQALGDRQRVRSQVLRAQRGAILDRNGNEFALSIPSSTVYANPKAVVNPETTARTLAEMLDLTEERLESLRAAFEAKSSNFVYVVRQIEPADAHAIDELHLPGIGVLQESRRYLPNGDVGRGLVGRTDIDGVGTSGLELQYDMVLKGRDGVLEREVGKKGRSMPSGDRALVNAVPGSDVKLTIDRSLQYRTEIELLKKVNELGARGGSAIIMESNTGRILAMASARRNPKTGRVEVGAANYAALDSYEPGSVGKVITASGALNEGTVTPETTFVVPGRKWYYDRYLSDAGAHGPMPWTVRQILTRSSNIGTITISETMGIVKQEEYMRSFGLGEKTALDFPNEGRGILRPHDQWRGTEKKTVAYGQGVASTAIQLVSAVNVIANGGEYVAPKLVESIIAPDGTETPTLPSAHHQVITPATAASMNSIMRDVVCKGTARGQITLPGYTVAGKTGTGYKAQKNGTYFDADGNRAYYASFVGFFPAEAPKVTMLVSIDEPPPGATHFGATTAAPVFDEIAAAAVVELGIQPPTADGGCPNAKLKG
jgi:cell division protein FtsI (penicillin-binding protein 3)